MMMFRMVNAAMTMFLIIFISLVMECRSMEDSQSPCDVIDQPLLLTPLINKNQTDKARNMSLVDNSFLEDFVPPSHSGFFTVNQTLGHHMFFWFFPSPTNPQAPLLLWLNGGPAVSSMLGLFHENGPMAVDRELLGNRAKYHKRQYSWVGPFSMLYVDNPIGTGFSYSDSEDRGELITEENVTRDLYSVLEQFLRVFPEYEELEIYIGGQSYAGMYVISLAHYIHTQRDLGRQDVDIAGIFLGAPFFDPERQLPKAGAFQYHTGIISFETYKKYVKAIEGIFENRNAILERRVPFEAIFSTFFPWMTSNNLATQEKAPLNHVKSLMNTLDMKRAVHVGRHGRFQSINMGVRNRLSADVLTSRQEKLAVVLDNFKTLIHNGILDAIIPSSSIEASLMQTPWKMQREYNESIRFRWQRRTGEKLGSYVEVGHLCRVVIEMAGHQSPFDNPEVTLRVMTDFIRYGCVKVGSSEFIWKLNDPIDIPIEQYL